MLEFSGFVDLYGDTIFLTVYDAVMMAREDQKHNGAIQDAVITKFFSLFYISIKQNQCRIVFHLNLRPRNIRNYIVYHVSEKRQKRRNL